MTIGEFFQQNGAAIIIAGFGAVPATVNIVLTWISNQKATENKQVALENRRVAVTGRQETEAKIDNMQNNVTATKEAVENGYHTAVAIAADVAATKVIERADVVGTKVVEKAEAAATNLVEKAKEVATALATGAYGGPERRQEDKEPPGGVDRRKQQKGN
jgi:hypothetical protein